MIFKRTANGREIAPPRDNRSRAKATVPRRNWIATASRLGRAEFVSVGYSWPAKLCADGARRARRSCVPPVRQLLASRRLRRGQSTNEIDSIRRLSAGEQIGDSHLDLAGSRDRGGKGRLMDRFEVGGRLRAHAEATEL
uniref:Uncharacterized protein n=1 Tax=Trichuris muris TaxID=70415 RepID=A0A5S6QX74_TRIMR